MITINEFIADCARKGRGGIRSLWLGRRSDFGNPDDGAFWTLQETSNLQFGVITGSTPFMGALTRAYNNSGTDTVTATLEVAPSRLNTIAWRCTIPSQDVEARDAIEQYFLSNDLLMVFEDWKGVCWIVGEEWRGIRMREWGFTTDTAGGQNAYTLLFDCVQRWPLRALSSTFVELITGDQTPLSKVDYTDGVTATDLGNTSLADLGIILYG